MKERPILFSTELVKEILAGRKTMTRRIINTQKRSPHLFEERVAKPRFSNWKETSDGMQAVFVRGDCLDSVGKELTYWVKSPYGDCGDKLWVREAWADVTDAFEEADEIRNVAFRADNSVWDCYGQMVYLEQLGDSGIEVKKWKPSIHLPKVASRLTLEIKDIKVEKLQDISDEDIKSEGFTTSHYYCDERVGHVCTSARDLFINRWDWLNAKRGFSWESNPFVWVIEFKKLENVEAPKPVSCVNFG